MKPVYTPEAEKYRRQVQDFLRQSLPAGWTGLWSLDEDARVAFVSRWRDKLAEERLLAPSWPLEYGGGGLTPLEHVVLAEEFAKARVPMGREVDSPGINMLGPILMAAGTAAQKERFLPGILSGETRWAQGFSEPEAGSDLASLRTRATLDGDEWVIDGQKTWTSLAHLANWIFLLCRTDPSAAKHRGISFLLVPLEQPGVEIRPLVNMVDRRDFNEVFFTAARTASDLVVGQVNGGWDVATKLLAVERNATSTTVAIVYRDELDRMIAMAKERGRTRDPLVRQRLAWCYSKVEMLRYLGMRILTRSLEGLPPGPESSLMKVIKTEYRKIALDLAMDIMGMEATSPTGHRPFYVIGTDPGAEFSSGGWIDLYLGAQPGSVYAGTSEIHRNLIGERILGLPREPIFQRDHLGQREGQRL